MAVLGPSWRRRALAVAALAAGWCGAAAVEAALAAGGGPATTAAAPPAAAAVQVPGPAPAAPAAPAAQVPGPAAPAAALHADDHEALAGHPPLLGTFRFTRYYVAEEAGARVHDDAEGDEPTLAATTGGGVTLYDDRGCRPVASVSRRFYDQLYIQGTGRLRDGRVVNISKSCSCHRSPCYRVVGRDARWGLGATSKPLQPFRHVAVDPAVIPLGSTLYIPELDGMTMPGAAPWGGFVHDGCVTATDVGGGVDGHHLDFFVGRPAYRDVLDARRRLKFVTVHDGSARCAAPRPALSRAGDS